MLFLGFKVEYDSCLIFSGSNLASHCSHAFQVSELSKMERLFEISLSMLAKFTKLHTHRTGVLLDYLPIQERLCLIQRSTL